jgi:hypothetical protein
MLVREAELLIFDELSRALDVEIERVLSAGPSCAWRITSWC